MICRKIYFLIILLFFIFNSSLKAEVVKKVDLKGSERITLETVVIFADIKIGEDYKQSDVSLIIKKLYETNFFSNISVELKNNKLTITVKENPLVDRIIFNGEKTKKYKEKIIEKLLVSEKAPFVENDIKRDVNQIKSIYRDIGFYFVKINAEIEKLDKNRVNIIYTIDKGEEAKISKIYFLGDKKIRDKRLRDIIISQEKKLPP